MTRLMTLLLVGLFSGSIFASQVEALCEFHLHAARAEHDFANVFRSDVRDRTFRLKSTNPALNVSGLAQLGLNIPALRGLQVTVVQKFAKYDPNSAFTVRFRLGKMLREILGSRLQPATYWVDREGQAWQGFTFN